MFFGIFSLINCLQATILVPSGWLTTLELSNSTPIFSRKTLLISSISLSKLYKVLKTSFVKSGMSGVKGFNSFSRMLILPGKALLFLVALA